MFKFLATENTVREIKKENIVIDKHNKDKTVLENAPEDIRQEIEQSKNVQFFNIYGNGWEDIETPSWLRTVAYRVNPVNELRTKSLNVQIYDQSPTEYAFNIRFKGEVKAELDSTDFYPTRNDAEDAAKKFCESLGFECIIIK